MINLTNLGKIYFAVFAAVILLIIFLSICFYRYHVLQNKRYKISTYAKVLDLAEKNDYLLLNNYKIDFDDRHVGVIDHLLISNKYIFVVCSFSISGVISGELKSRTLNVYKPKGKMDEVINPMNYLINMVKRVTLYNELNESFVKGIVVVNDDSVVNIDNLSDKFLMVRRSDLASAIEKFDKEKIGNLKEENVVKFINKLNMENNKDEQVK